MKSPAIPPPSLRCSRSSGVLARRLCFAQTAAPAAATPAPPSPAPSLEQRVAGLEAYLANGDPTAALKNRPKDQGWQPDDPEA